jgi:hypothetical protein
LQDLNVVAHGEDPTLPTIAATCTGLLPQMNQILLNGASQGKNKDSVNGVFIWKDVPLKPCDNQVEARAERGGKKLSDACVWTLKTPQR